MLENHMSIIQKSAPGHFIHFIKVKDPYLHFLVNIPVSLFGGLFMPLFWQGTNVLIKTTGVINSLLLIFFAGKMYGILKTGIKTVGTQEVFILGYIITLAILLSYTTPNFGTLERYKISYIAFFTIWVFHRNPFLEYLFSNLKH
jgi:hypothetical protein